MLDKIILNKYVKGLLPPILSFIIGILGNAFFSVDPTSSNSTILRFLYGFFIIACALFDIYLLATYIKNEKTIEDITTHLNKIIQDITSENNNLRTKNDALFESLKMFQKNFETNSNRFFRLIKNARLFNKIDLNIWNKDMISDYICSSIKEIITGIAETGKDFDVNLIIPMQTYHNTTKYFMISDASDGVKPEIYHAELSESEAQKYYFGKLFKKEISEYEVLMNKEEINREFFWKDPHHKGKYEQYIALPIFCDSHKMIGLLEICAEKDCFITHDYDNMVNIINQHIKCYADYYLMAYKIEQAVSFVPQKGVKKK